MGKIKWAKDRKWEISKTAKRFENLLHENRFEILGFREYVSKTCYLIEKDGVQVEYSVANVDQSVKRGDLCFKCFFDMYCLQKELEQLRK